MLKDIPARLNVRGTIFHLRGVVHFKAPLKTNATSCIGHYTAFCWRPSVDKWQHFDDLVQEMRYVRNSTIVNGKLFIFTK